MKLVSRLIFAGLAALLMSGFSVLSGCTVSARPAHLSIRATPLVVRMRPPAARVEVRRACPGGSYWKTGRWQWNGRRYVWLRGGCKRYPTGRVGCGWVAGRWTRTGHGWRWTSGRWRCNVRRPVVVVRRPVPATTVAVGTPGIVVSMTPPRPRVEVRRSCPGGSYWKTGRWQWNGRRYVWLAGGCKRYPTGRVGCGWTVGRWSRTGHGWRWVSGRWSCHGVSGRVMGSVARRCPLGTHRVGRACVRNVARRCPVGTHRVGRACVRNVARRCPLGTHRVGRACVRNVARRCPAGTHRVAGRCVRVRRACPPRTKRVGNRCVPVRHACPANTKRVGNRCVPLRVKHAVRRCPAGRRLVHGRCVVVHRAGRCPRGYVRRGRRCVRRHR